MRRTPFASAALVGVVMLACSGPAQRRYEEQLAETPAPAEHKIHGERLAELMRGLARLRTERLPPAMEVETQREVRAQRLAEVALALAGSARKIPAASDASELDADQRREFRLLADQLRSRSERLAELARQRPTPDLEPQLASVDATCDACHERFRAGGLRDGS